MQSCVTLSMDAGAVLVAVASDNAVRCSSLALFESVSRRIAAGISCMQTRAELVMYCPFRSANRSRL